MRAGQFLAVAAAAAVAVVPLAAAPARAADASAVLTVAPEDGGIVRDGRPVDVEVRITNTGADAMPAGRLALSLGTGPVASSAALLDEVTQPPLQLQGQLLTRTRARTPALAPGASATVDVRIPAADVAETPSPDADGARLLDVQLRAGDRIVLGRSALTLMSPGAPEVGFGTVVPVTIPAGTTGVVDVAGQAEATGSSGAWTAALDAARAMPAATVALDPAVVASIRLAGDAAPPSATAFLDDLQALGNETVRLAYADGDVTLQRAAGLDAPLAPRSFAGSVATAQSSSSSTGSATPAATPDPTTAPSVDDLTAWDWSSTQVVWPVPGTTTAGDLAALGADGRMLLLGSQDVGDSAERAAAGPLASVSDRRVLVADGAVSGLLATAAEGDVPGRSAEASMVAALATDAEL